MSRRLISYLLFLVLLTICTAPAVVFATHQRAAEITFKHVKDLTYEITLISYTFTPSPANAYRDFLTVNWGDGETSDIQRQEIINLPDDITYNRYWGEHNFHGPATYTISCEDPNRNGGILNIPNSINTPLFIYSELTISPFIGGYNDSPVLLNPPVDNGCVNQIFYHNPGAYDADGDSLSYRLVPCRGALGQVIPGYTYPKATSSLTLNALTGDLIWDSPEQQGEYNVAILIEEWRNGFKIGSVLRDMQIIVVACNNQPPVIDSVFDTCVEAGKNLRFMVRAHDPDSPDTNNVTLTATGGPFIIAESPATLEPNPATGHGQTQALFRWSTVCNHIQNRPYQVFFKAKDDASPVSLVSFKSVNIMVIGPAPKNLVTNPTGNTISLSWDDYICANASGYDIYRKADSTGYIPDYCETGVPPYLGYTKIASLTGISQTTYLDDNNGAGLMRGLKYCYLVVAYYPDKAESYASNEACATLNKDLAVITNASITNTSETDGSIYVAWSKPTEIDTIQIPGPYKYMVVRSRSDAPAQFVPVDSLSNLNDTILTDQKLNTRLYHYLYRIDLYNAAPGNRFLIGSSQVASTIFLRAVPTDKMIKLFWNNEVPWNNHWYTVFRKGADGITFDSIGTTTATQFNDKGLTNGVNYCYKIKSTGNYSASGFIDPIINFSQEICATPIDNVPPCPPLLSINTICEQSQNVLSWTKPADSCPGDIAKYYIYYTQQFGKPALIDSIANPFDTNYIHKPFNSIAGCYGVAAIDSVGNISDTSNIVCIDYTACPRYALPNIFTPNGDGKNDYFIPFPDYTSVSSVSMKIFDRWGKIVFETQDPAIEWDGNDKTSNQPCSDGTYFYICDVTEITLNGSAKRNLHGSLTILR
ncbi:MAG: gliding motility-associated C-terminal domain-containing protein [Bacteroidetes bacterium]|nr:gliding motility-associated C-terminal domain-containing protein [Bacteroidota bacterium]